MGRDPGVFSYLFTSKPCLPPYRWKKWKKSTTARLLFFVDVPSLYWKSKLCCVVDRSGLSWIPLNSRSLVSHGAALTEFQISKNSLVVSTRKRHVETKKLTSKTLPPVSKTKSLHTKMRRRKKRERWLRTL